MTEFDFLSETQAVIRKVNRVWGTKIELQQKNTDLTELQLVENGKTLVRGDICDIELYVGGMLLLTELKQGE